MVSFSSLSSFFIFFLHVLKTVVRLKEPLERESAERDQFFVPVFSEIIPPEAFIVKAEDYGIPQCRHRVIILGIREDIFAQTKLETDLLHFIDGGRK